MKKLKMLMTIAAGVLVAAAGARAQFFARDPGVRGGPAGAGGMLEGLTGLQPAFFTTGLAEFEEADTLEEGLGPRFNLDSCVGCHSQPATGGTSPAVNPQVTVATAFGALNRVPSFITLDGPVREARFKYKPDGTRDGGDHAQQRDGHGRGDPARRAERHREVCVLHAVPGPADALARHPGRGRLDRPGSLLLRGGRMRAVSYASAPNGRLDGRGARLQAGEPLLRPAGPQHGARPGRRRPPGPSGRRRVQDRAALGPRPAYLL